MQKEFLFQDSQFSAQKLLFDKLVNQKRNYKKIITVSELYRQIRKGHKQRLKNMFLNRQLAIRVPRKLQMEERTFRYLILGALGLSGIINSIIWIVSSVNKPREKQYKELDTIRQKIKQYQKTLNDDIKAFETKIEEQSTQFYYQETEFIKIVSNIQTKIEQVFNREKYQL